MKRLIAILLVLLFIASQPVIGDIVEEKEPEIKITEVYYKSQPGCEYFVLSNWGKEGQIDELLITDIEGELVIEDIRFKEGEEIVIAADKNDYEDIWYEEPDLLKYEDFETSGNFRLANQEDELLVYVDGDLSDAFYYGDGEGGKGWVGERSPTLGHGSYAKRRDQDTNSAEDWNWSRDWKVGHSDFSSESFSYYGNMTAFTSPDGSYEAVKEFFSGIEESLKVSIYEFRNLHLAESMAEMSDDGIDVKVFAEAVPVGGLSEEVKKCLSKIENSGGDVYLMGKEDFSPYRFLHSKIMIADSESVLISSENFGYNGYPTNPTYGNRGWGAVLEDKEIADYYTQVFWSDMKFSSRFFSTYGDDLDIIEEDRLGTYSKEFEPLKLEDYIYVETVLSPDTSKDSILEMIDSSEDSIYLQQFYIRYWEQEENPFINNIIERAKDGVEVKIILDSMWYNLGDNGVGNDDIVQELNNISEEKNIDLEAKLISDEHRFSKVHNKGLIVDEEKVLVSSINWNSNSVLQNREVGVIICNKYIGEYFSEIFLSDWRDDIIDPIADAGRDIETNIDSVVELRADNSWDDNNISRYRWDVNKDGHYEGEGKRFSTIFTESGTYEVLLYVEDECGNWDTDTVTIIVEEEKSTWIDTDGSETNLPYLSFLILFTVIGVMIYRKYG